MANTHRYRRGPKIDRWVEKTGTVEIQIGDLIKYTSSGKVMETILSTDSEQLIGIAMEQSPTTDATNTGFRVLEGGHGTVFELKTNTTDQWRFGDSFVISGSQTLTKKTVDNPLNTGTNIVAICVEDSDGSAAVVSVELLAGRAGGFKIVNS